VRTGVALCKAVSRSHGAAEDSLAMDCEGPEIGGVGEDNEEHGIRVLEPA